MLTKMVLNNNDYTKTMVFDNETVVTSYHDYNYAADERNMRTNGVITYENNRITVYERPTDNGGCNTYDNTAHCIAIARELDDVANGYVVRCSECGELISAPNTDTDTDSITLECGCEIDTIDANDLEIIDMYDYFDDDIYDIEYRIDSQGRYKSAKIMITCGGPNMYINTDSGCIELYWWGDTASAVLAIDTIEQIDGYFAEVYNCTVKGVY